MRHNISKARNKATSTARHNCNKGPRGTCHHLRHRRGTSHREVTSAAMKNKMSSTSFLETRTGKVVKRFAPWSCGCGSSATLLRVSPPWVPQRWCASSRKAPSSLALRPIGYMSD